ncbi:MAG: prephenate dehydratase [Planctomycetota bacterium]
MSDKGSSLTRTDAETEKRLAELRSGIDSFDKQIVSLINQRATLAAEIGLLKRDQKAPVYVPHREAAVYQKVAEANNGPLPDNALKAIYREIMSATIALQRPTRVCYFGAPGSFSHAAAYNKFGSGVDYLHTSGMEDVFREVSNENADFGVIPIENSTEGTVSAAVDLLAETHLRASGELFLHVHHNLLSICARNDIDIIFSHPQPFGQCRNWLTANYPNAELRPTRSTSAAAKEASETPRSAAIASRLASELYNVPVLHANIEDIQNNITRFFIIGRSLAERTGHDKTSLVFSVKDEPGALLRMLMPFEDNKVNLTKIESRPSRRKAWEYIFFVDFIGHHTDENAIKAIETLRGHCRFLEIIGSYPIASMPDSPSDGGRRIEPINNLDKK